MSNNDEMKLGKCNICLVVVTYNPNELLLKNISATNASVREIIIIDNNSIKKDVLNRVHELNFNNVRVVENEVNSGLAAALNQGVKYAIQNNNDYIITMDQDSYFKEGAIEILYDVMEQNPDIALLGPDIINQFTQKRKYPEFKFYDGLFYLNGCIMQSGSIYRTSVFKNVGLFEEQLFMYYIDDDYCKRLVTNYKIAICNKAILYHEEGENGKKKYGNKEYFYRKYSENALYFICRNCIYMIRKYGIYESKRIIIEVKNIMMFQDNKMKLLLACRKGIVDGLLGKFGGRDEK